MTSKPPEGFERVLASDLDGTLIPLRRDEGHLADLRTLGQEIVQNSVTLVFATGRHFESVMRAIDEFGLPTPDWIICDVGTSIFQRRPSGKFEPVVAYQQHQANLIADKPIGELRQRLRAIAGLRLQEEERQGPFKLSFYSDANRLEKLVHAIQLALDEWVAPYSITHSVDPFNGDGLIDLLPTGVSKAHALAWWSEHVGHDSKELVFAGDSGNDLAALTAGYRAIVVGNADRELARKVFDAHREAGWRNRLYLARGIATTGVLEGCRWFGLLETAASTVRRLGATPLSHDSTYFRVWAPSRRRVDVEVRHGAQAIRQSLIPGEQGYFAGRVPNAAPDSTYRYVLDGGIERPDPASRYQPDGVHGASQIIARSFPWTDQDWRGVEKRDLVIYEFHVGAFTSEGTFRAAIDRLDQLVELGVTALELMPIAQSSGRWNWGYDGVGLFAVRNTYGKPDDFKAFVEACHRKGLAVILDVVYNHLGPEGNYLHDFGPYFSSKHRTPWGEAFNFDGRHSQHVRQFIIENAVLWLEEYHLDGLRLDAVHFMLDDSQPSILDEIRAAVSDYAQQVDRKLHLIAEANIYDQELLKTKDCREPYDGIWCDCLMHSVYSHALPDLRLTHREYNGAHDLAAALQQGYVYVGTAKPATDAHRDVLHNGEDGRSHLTSLVTAMQTHDSVGNHPHGKRIHQLTSKKFQKAAASLVLMYPSIPLIFMGEEFASDTPFPFFVDFEDASLRNAVDKGRPREYSQHDWRNAPLPSDAQTFLQANLDAAQDRDLEMFQWYQALLALRRQGLAAGWLSPSRMSSEYDANEGMFLMRYACRGSGSVIVRARLTGPATLGDDAVMVAVNGQVLLSTTGNRAGTVGHVELGPNDVVISLQ